MVIKGIDIKLLSKCIKEDKKLYNNRKESLVLFNEASKPIFGPDMKIDYDSLIFYNDDNIQIDNYKDIPLTIKNKIKKYSINKNNLIIQSDYSILYKDINDIECYSFNKIPKDRQKLFNSCFNKLIKNDENIFTMLNSSMYSNSLFIYIPSNCNKEINRLISIDSNNLGIVNKIIIVVDDNSELKINDYILSNKTCKDNLFTQTVEIFLKKNSVCEYKTIQDLSHKTYNAALKRAQLDSNAIMKWTEVNIGSSCTMSYPTSILSGINSSSKCINITCSKDKQILDTGSKMLHQAQNTNSEIICHSIVKDGSEINNRCMVRISTSSTSSNSKVTNNTYLLSNNSTYNLIPRDILRNNTSSIKHINNIKSSKKSIESLLDSLLKK